MQRTPGIYTDINTQTQRTGLPNQSHSIVFVTADATAPVIPTPIYDTATADAISGDNSKSGRMMAAALMVSQGVRVETVGKSEGWAGVGNGSGGSGGGLTDFSTLPVNNSVVINNAFDSMNGPNTTFSIEVNGVMYNADKLLNVTDLDAAELYAQMYMSRGSDGSISFWSAVPETLEVRLSPSDEQKLYSNKYISGEGAIEADGTFVFKLGTA